MEMRTPAHTADPVERRDIAHQGLHVDRLGHVEAQAVPRQTRLHKRRFQLVRQVRMVELPGRAVAQ
jgi:hypothetical protein